MMGKWIVRYSNGATVVVEAWSAADAKAEAERQAELDGWPGLSVTSVELID